jgi:REP element-mobilizing transposase RayT
MRKIKFQNDYYYHIFNRGADKREVFSDSKDYLRFLESIRDFNRLEPILSIMQFNRNKESSSFLKEPGSFTAAPLVEILCYCLNPNHFHLLLKQIVDNGISKFMHKLSLGYTNYFNKKNNRSGVLFQGKFKAVKITSDEQLLYVSAYINGNAQIHQIGNAEKWPYSTYPDYLEMKNNLVFEQRINIPEGLNKKVILENFKDIAEYKDFTCDVIKNSSKIKEDLKNLRLE